MLLVALAISVALVFLSALTLLLSALTATLAARVVVVLLLTSSTRTLTLRLALLTLSLSWIRCRTRLTLLTRLTLTALATSLLLLTTLLALLLLTRLTLLLLLAATLTGLAHRLGLPVLVVLDVLHERLEVVDRGLLWLELSRGHLLNALQGHAVGSQVLVARDQLVLVDLAVSRDVDCLVQSALRIELVFGDVVVQEVIVLVEQDRRDVFKRLSVDEVVAELCLLVQQPERVDEQIEARR